MNFSEMRKQFEIISSIFQKKYFGKKIIFPSFWKDKNNLNYFYFFNNFKEWENI